MSEAIMTFHIIIDRDEISKLDNGIEQAVIIPFGGYTESELFKGKILPGAADVQTVNAAGIRHMCAQYMFEGIDAKGNKCHLFVQNNGYFEPASSPSPFHACPSFMSDSPYLSAILSKPVYRAEGHPAKGGVDILIFDVTKETDYISAAPQKPAVDPYLLELSEKETADHILIEAKRIYEEEHVRKLVFFSSHNSETYVLENPDEKIIAGILNDLPDTPQMVFMINEKGQLAALSWITGKVRNIADIALNIFADIFKENGQDRYFDRPVNRYARWQINEYS